MDAVIGIDIGGTHFRAGTVDEAGKVTDFRKLPVTRVFRSGDPMGELTDFLEGYRRGKRVEAVAIGFPATLDGARRRVIQAPNVPFLEDLPVADVLEEALGLPVFIERDVTMALRYDCEKYGVPDRGIVCGFYFGTGVGNAIAINGVPLIGRNGTAGELGHIPVDGSDLLCGCGNRGCLENLAGGKHLAELCRMEFDGTPIGELFKRHWGAESLRRFVDRMAMAVATEINILDPHCILIGGGVPAMEGFPNGYLLERIRFHTRKPLPAASLNILLTEDDAPKAVIGAAIHGRKMLEKR